jgi:hypothetical protein
MSSEFESPHHENGQQLWVGLNEDLELIPANDSVTLQVNLFEPHFNLQVRAQAISAFSNK